MASQRKNYGDIRVVYERLLIAIAEAVVAEHPGRSTADIQRMLRRLKDFDRDMSAAYPGRGGA